ncbi:hypothetical protein ACIA58_08820 [Kribbella sp. NPDC051586]|uniref:hypothetical protein n=1 Tax=Kribbella sp. NPDC051586 TaxID=3364118 RepID=UPI0037B1947A
MEYAEFEVEYKRVADSIIEGRRDTDLTAEIPRLRALAEQIDDEDDRHLADSVLAGIEDIIAREPGEPPSEIILQAREAFAEGDRNEGTVAERLARAEEAVRALSRIAANGTPDEQREIGALEHTLQMLIGALRLMR